MCRSLRRFSWKRYCYRRIDLFDSDSDGMVSSLIGEGDDYEDNFDTDVEITCDDEDLDSGGED